MYEGDATPDHEAIAAFGLKLEGAEEEHTECWPENWEPLQVFSVLQTQWNVGQASVIGLRYEAIPVAMQMAGVSMRDKQAIYRSLQVMELEALSIFNKKK